VLLSDYSFQEADVPHNPPGVRGWPHLLWARLDLGDGQRLLAVAGYLESPYSSNSDCALLVCYDIAERDSLTPRNRGVDCSVPGSDHCALRDPGACPSATS
jgi:hypothetical protein